MGLIFQFNERPSVLRDKFGGEMFWINESIFLLCVLGNFARQPGTRLLGVLRVADRIEEFLHRNNFMRQKRDHLREKSFS